MASELSDPRVAEIAGYFYSPIPCSFRCESITMIHCLDARQFPTSSWTFRSDRPFLYLRASVVSYQPEPILSDIWSEGWTRVLGVVFVHGIKSSARMWEPFVALMEGDEDLTGVAAEPRPRFEYATAVWSARPLQVIPSLDTAADSLKEYLHTEANNFERLVLVGHSQGGLVIERCLVRMLHDGLGYDLMRIRRVILLATPNTGSQLLLGLRRSLVRSNPQERALRPYDEQLTDTLRALMRDVVNATEVSERTCPIPFSVYAAESDGVVTPASARAVFLDAGVLPGDHFTIATPDSREHRTYTTVKRLLIRTAAEGDRDLPTPGMRQMRGLTGWSEQPTGDVAPASGGWSVHEDPEAERQGEFVEDLTAVLQRLDEQARIGRLPPYLPPGADVADLARTVRIRQGVRSGKLTRPEGKVEPDAEDEDKDDEDKDKEPGDVYGLPADRREESAPSRWPDIVASYPQLMVLADPGLGKSWLIRTETHRLAAQALTRLEADPAGVIIPVPIRCDQLIAAPGQDLADKAAAYLVGTRLLPQRSYAALAAKIRAGEAALLLDALDELPASERGVFRELLRWWADQIGDRARCVITSRIAGYTGTPLPMAREVELQPFTPADVKEALAAWRLPPQAARRILDRVADPAVAAMTRIPLLLALLCALTIELPSAQSLPRTRGQLYGRVLRWFLTREHRVADNPAGTELEDFEVGGLLELLAPVAFTFADTSEGWMDLMPADRLLAAIRSAGPPFNERQSRADRVLRELSVEAGIFVPAGDPSAGRNPPYLFLHRTVAEYLVARYLAALPRTAWLAVVEQHRWFDPEWTQVITMLGELLSPAEEAGVLIDRLLAEQSDPFHDSLFTALQVWGTRPDADDLLPPARAAHLAEKAVRLLWRERTRSAVTLQITAMTYLPRALLDPILLALGHDKWPVRSAAAAALAGRADPAPTTALRRCLDDPDRAVRAAAVRALAGRTHPDLTTELAGHLNDPSKSVQIAAAEALAEYKDTDTAAALSDHIDDRDRAVRCAAATALASRDDPPAVAALARHLAPHDDEVGRAIVNALAARIDSAATAALTACLSGSGSVRSAAMTALAERSDPGAVADVMHRLGTVDHHAQRNIAKRLAAHDDPSVVAALLPNLRSDDRDVRYTVVIALAGNGDPAVTKAVAACLSDRAPGVRIAAAEALTGRNDPAATEALARQVTDKDAFVLKAVTKALTGRDDPAATAALLRIATDPKKESPRLTYEDPRQLAVEALAGNGDPTVVAALLQALTDPADKNVRRSAAKALARNGDPAVVAALLQALTDPDKSVQLSAGEALARRDDPALTFILMEGLRDPHRNARSGYMRALAGSSHPDVTATLMEGLRDPDPDVRLAAVQALAGSSGPAVAEALVSRLTDKNGPVRVSAEQALAESVDPATTAALINSLDTTRWHMRLRAVEILVRRRDPGSTAALAGCLRDRDQEVRIAAVEAFAQRDDPAAAPGLVTCLVDVDDKVRRAAVKTLTSRESSQDLLAIAAKAGRISRSPAQEFVDAAEELMNRYYRRIAPSERPAVRAAMAQLTAALTDKRAN